MGNEAATAPDISGPVPGGDGGLASALGSSQPAAPQPEPTSNSPLSDTLTPPPGGGNLASTLQPAVNPKLHRTFMSTLKGLALGYMEGNIPGAIQGAIDPSIPQRVLEQRRQVMNAQTADVLNRARINEINLQNLPQHLRDEHDSAVLDRVKFLSTQYGAPDETFDNSSEAAHEALTKHVASGNVPLGHVISDSNTTYAWHADRASQASNAYQDVHDAGVLDGNPALSGIKQAQWDALDQKDKSGMWAKAQQALVPVAPSIDAKERAGQVQAASRQLQTVQGLPDTDPSKARLVKFAQTNLDILNKADADPKFTDKPDEDSRTKFLQGVQSSTLPADLKKTYTNFINQAKTGTHLDQAIKTVTEDIGKYQTGVDSARQKQADAQGANPEWKPKVTADEKKKAELAENISFNANEINGLLSRRPDLVGKISGRFTNAEQMTGNDDRDISAIGMAVHNTAMANNGVHGLRSAEEVQRTEQKILNGFKNGPNAVSGALGEITGSVQTFIDNARPETYQTHSKKGGAASYYQKQGQQQKQPAGATMKVPGSDGKLHWSDGKADLGVAE